MYIYLYIYINMLYILYIYKKRLINFCHSRRVFVIEPIQLQVRIDKTTINLQHQVLCVCDLHVNKRSLLQKCSYVGI